MPTLLNKCYTLTRLLHSVDPDEEDPISFDDICDVVAITKEELERLCTDPAYLEEQMDLDLVLQLGQANGESVWLTLFFNGVISEETYRGYHNDDHDFWVGIKPELGNYQFSELAEVYELAKKNDALMSEAD
jgi:hypothetical protein